MASRGESKGQKALSAQKIRFFNRKKHVWSIKNRTGPHSKNSSVPLGFIVRDVLGFASTRKETKMVLNSQNAKVNGTAITDMNFSVGLFDIVEFPEEKKMFRMILDKKGRAKIVEMEKGAVLEKVSKILHKRVAKNGLIELTTSEGFVLKQGKNAVGVSDSVKMSLPDKKITGHFSLSAGKMALIIGGTHAGEVVKIKEIIPGSMHKPKLVKTEGKHGEISTLEKYVCVVGDNKTCSQMNLEVFE